MTNWAQIHEFYKRYHKIEKMFIFQARVFKFSDLLGEEKLAKFQGHGAWGVNATIIISEACLLLFYISLIHFSRFMY